jgi:hypothetical protein
MLGDGVAFMQAGCLVAESDASGKGQHSPWPTSQPRHLAGWLVLLAEVSERQGGMPHGAQ